MGNALHERRLRMEEGIAQYGLDLAGQGAHGGSSVWMRAPEGIDTQVLADRLHSKGVLIEPGQSFFGGEERPRNYYRLGYSSIPASRINSGLQALASGIASMTDTGSIPP